MSEVNFLAENFSLILQYTTDYEYQLSRLTDMFINVLYNIDEKNFLSIDFLKESKAYPKYPVDFRVIDSLNKYNLVTIYNIAQDDVEYLLEAISTDEVLSLKNNFDPIPKENIKNDYDLQTAFFSNITTEYFDSLIYNGFTLDITRRSYLFKTFTTPIDPNIRNSSLIYLYTLYTFLVRNFRYCLKIFENIYLSPQSLTLKNSDFLKSFDTYIHNNKSDITDGIAQFILAYTYKIINPSGCFLKELNRIISTQLEKLIDVFSSAMSTKTSITSNLVQYASEILYNHLAAKITNSAGDSNIGLINTETYVGLRQYENELYSEVFSRYSPYLIKEYLYLVYYYKLYPKKFLNVLQLILIDYAEKNLIEQDQNVFNLNYLQSSFKRLVGSVNVPSSNGLNFQELEDLLSVITPNFLIETIEEERIAEFTIRTRLISLFEDVFSFKNNEFNDWMDETYRQIFDYLKNTVQIEPTYEFYFNQKMLYWYLLAYLKRDILLNKIFKNEEIELSEILNDIIKDSNFSPKFSVEKMRSRTAQYLEGNINNIGNLFENLLETTLEKQLHREHIAYFLN